MRQALLRETSLRGEDFFRSAVIEALGDYKAQYAFDALIAVAKLDGPLQDDAALALGKIGDKRALETLADAAADRAAAVAAVDRRRDLSARRQLRVARELSGRDVEVRHQQPEPRIPGAAPRRGRRPWRAGRRGGHDEAVEALFEIGIPSRDPTRAPVSLALATVALRNTPLMLIGARKARRSRARHRSRRRRLRHARGRSRQGNASSRCPTRLLGLARGIANARVDADAHREAGVLMDYRQSGVDIDAGNETVRRIKSLARATFTPGVLSDIGSFGGLFRLDRDRFQEPVLVSSADGVGTKLKVAFMTGRHDTIGADLVNHCVNDILVQGAEPLFFLDYLATGRLSPDVAEQVVGGVARACRENGCALIGGETAEMPGFYADGEYDIAGFIVGAVERTKIVDGRAIVPGDVLIGLPSAGLHTNGYLARAARVLRRRRAAAGYIRAGARRDGRGRAAGAAPFAICPSSVRCSRASTSKVWPTLPVAASPRICRGYCRKVARRKSIGRPGRCRRSFGSFRSAARVSSDEMFRAFNMGIGLVVACTARDAERVMNSVARAGEPAARRIGVVVSGERAVRYIG